MKATLPANAQIDNLKPSHRLENHFHEEYAAITPDGKTPVTLRLYTRDGSRWTCCLWVNAYPVSLSGSGQATGYGYHKPSAAAAAAIRAAGITLSRDIAGRGDSAIYDTVEAIAKAATGKRKVYVHRAHA